MSWCAFSSSSSFVCCSSSCWLRSSSVSDCDWRSSSSVRIVASIVAITMPSDSSIWSRNASWMPLNRSNDASSITPLTSPSNRIGTTTIECGVRLAERAT